MFEPLLSCLLSTTDLLELNCSAKPNCIVLDRVFTSKTAKRLPCSQTCLQGFRNVKVPDFGGWFEVLAGPTLVVLNMIINC